MRAKRTAAGCRAWSPSGGRLRRELRPSPHIPTWTFWYWCRKLSAVPVTPPPSFVPVQVLPDPETPVLEIVFKGGECF
jgi:hypothetical protein